MTRAAGGNGWGLVLPSPAAAGEGSRTRITMVGAVALVREPHSLLQMQMDPCK